MSGYGLMLRKWTQTLLPRATIGITGLLRTIISTGTAMNMDPGPRMDMVTTTVTTTRTDPVRCSASPWP